MQEISVGDERKTVKEIKYRTKKKKRIEEKIWKQQAEVQGGKEGYMIESLQAEKCGMGKIAWAGHFFFSSTHYYSCHVWGGKAFWLFVIG